MAFKKPAKAPVAVAPAPAPVAAPAPAPAPVAAEAEAEVEVKNKHNKKLEILGDYSDESKIEWHVSENPRAKGRGTHTRFEKYMGAETVGDYKKAGGTQGDLNWDLRTGYLSIEGVSLGGEITPRERSVRKATNGGTKAAAAAAEPKGKATPRAKPRAQVEEEAAEEKME